jgi:hypothetical protein
LGCAIRRNQNRDVNKNGNSKTEMAVGRRESFTTNERDGSKHVNNREELIYVAKKTKVPRGPQSHG